MMNKFMFIQYIGEVIQVQDEDIPNGSYLIVDVANSVTLFNIKTEAIEEVNKFKNNEFIKLEVPIAEKVEFLYEANIKLVLNLIQNGWVLPSEEVTVPNQDITPYIAKVKVLKILKDTEQGVMYETN